MVIFDFDGVLLDSVDEVIVSTFNTIHGTLHASLGALPKDFVDRFRANRFHVQPAGDLLTLARWCIANIGTPIHVLTHKEFRELIRDENEPILERAKKFFATRTVLAEKDFATWVALNRVYQPLWGAVSKNPEEVVLLTNKNRRATREICHHFGLQIPDANIFASDGGVTKHQNFQQIRSQFPAKKYLFIDDSIHNLIDLRKSLGDALGVTLAAWGYCSNQDRDLARKENIVECRQEDAIDYFTRMNL